MKNIKRQVLAFVRRSGIEPVRGAPVELIAGGGSDRYFFRIRSDDGSWVVMTAPAFRADIRSYIDVSRYLREQGIGVPELVACDDDRQMVLMEDLGSLSLLSALRRTAGRAGVLALYRQVLEFQVEMTVRATPAMHACNYLRHRSFGYESFRWETDYFKECCLRRLCGSAIDNEAALDSDFHALAEALAACPRFFMHRDFQSQNIFIKDNRIRIVDFQTATRGLFQYDLASLLKDAYFVLQPSEQDELARTYFRNLSAAGVPEGDEDAFVDLFHRAGLQRGMQALGAFAFLGLDRAKEHFLQYIPDGLRLLGEGLALLPEYPALNDVISQVLHDLMHSEAWPLRGSVNDRQAI
jgi:N-acetylmuramate 1-kinase